MKTKLIVSLAVLAGISAGAVTYMLLSSSHKSTLSGLGESDDAAVVSDVNGAGGVASPSLTNAAAAETPSADPGVEVPPNPTVRPSGEGGESGDDRGESEGMEGEDREGGGTSVVPSRPARIPTPAPVPTPTPKPAPNPATPPAPKTYSMSDIAKHGGAASCWTTISGKVYDLTNWIAQHPGGEGTILSICGIDGTAAFNGQHGSRGAPASILNGYQIGLLK